MSLRMTALARTKFGKFQARKAIPRDVAREYEKLFGQSAEAWFAAPAGTSPNDVKAKFAAWLSEVEARIAAIRARKCKDAYILKVEKRNNMAVTLPITLHWADGALLPQEALAGADRETVFHSACVNLAIDSAADNQPLTAQKNLSDWQLGRLETYAGFRPTQRQVKEALAKAVHDQKLRYVRGTKKHQAGYFAFGDPTAAPEVTHGSTIVHGERPSADWSTIAPKIAPSDDTEDFTPLNDEQPLWECPVSAR